MHHCMLVQGTSTPETPAPLYLGHIIVDKQVLALQSRRTTGPCAPALGIFTEPSEMLVGRALLTLAPLEACAPAHCDRVQCH